jgi:hypothetical protein
MEESYSEDKQDRCLGYQMESPKNMPAIIYETLAKTGNSVETQVEFQHETDETSLLLRHVRVYAIAEKYSVEGLKSLAKFKFSNTLKSRLFPPGVILLPHHKSGFATVVEEV